VGDWKDSCFGVEGLDVLTVTEVVGKVFRRFAGDVNLS
jgi:hypothetical protein